MKTKYTRENIYKKKKLWKNDQAILRKNQKNLFEKENATDRFARIITCDKNEYTERLTRK